MVINQELIKDIALSGITDAQLIELIARRQLSENLRIIQEMKDDINKDTEEGAFVRTLIAASSTQDDLIAHTIQVLCTWNLDLAVSVSLPKYVAEYLVNLAEIK